jgi:hypothetical protein
MASFPNSIPFKKLRHPQYTPTFKLSFSSIPLFSKLPRAFPPLLEIFIHSVALVGYTVEPLETKKSVAHFQSSKIQ